MEVVHTSEMLVHFKKTLNFIVPPPSGLKVICLQVYVALQPGRPMPTFFNFILFQTTQQKSHGFLICGFFRLSEAVYSDTVHGPLEGLVPLIRICLILQFILMCSFFLPTVLNNYMVISSYRQRVILEVHNQTGQSQLGLWFVIQYSVLSGSRHRSKWVTCYCLCHIRCLLLGIKVVHKSHKS
jgi:hypothetical protein